MEKVDALLIFPPLRLNDEPRNFPTGIGLLAAYAIREGFEVDVLDLNGLRPTRDEALELIKRYDTNIYGMGGLITTYGYTKWLAGEIRKINPDAVIIAGGSVASPVPHVILNKTEVDIACIGEGEQMLVDLIRAVRANTPFDTIKGIAFLRDGGLVKTPERPFFADINTLPLPAWELFPMDVYMANPVVGVGRDMDLVTSRGCPYGCVYCYRLFGRKYRFRSAGHVMGEIDALKRRYNIDFVSFQDDCFVISKARIYELCDLLDRSGYGLKWSCTGRVNICTDKKLIRRMKESGCTSISFGVESGSATILKALNKGAPLDITAEAIRVVRDAGLRTPASFMLGMFGETRETVWETVEFCKREKIPLGAVMFVTPYPGTPIYDQALRKGLIKDEEAFILSLGDALDFTINLTDIDDKELVALREEMIKAVRSELPPLTHEEIQRKELELYGPELYHKGELQRKDAAFLKHRKEHGFNEE